MSIIIKGMEMPKSCDMCWALDDYGDYPRCRITEEQRGYNFPIRQKRMDNCPLVPVPAHGRLIDADALRDWSDDSAMIAFDYVTRSQINAAPTIIPASEEGE